VRIIPATHAWQQVNVTLDLPVDRGRNSNDIVAFISFLLLLLLLMLRLMLMLFLLMVFVF